MNEIVKVVLSLSFSGSLLIILLFLCKRFWQDKVSRQWQYYIWLLVIARLLLPVAPETNLMSQILQTLNNTTVQDDMVQPLKSSPSGFEGDKLIKTSQGESVTQPGFSFVPQPMQQILLNQFWLIWLSVALLLFLRKILIYHNFVRSVRAGQTPVADVIRLDQLALISTEMQVKKAVELCVNPLVSSPMLMGFFRPAIVLPDCNLPEEEFRCTVLHELTHYKRRDMFYKWLVQFTVCLHWFNPLVYLMSREINKACEFSCDEAIIAQFDASHIEVYGKTLLHAMAVAGSKQEPAASVTLSANKKLLKERLCAIVNYRKKSKLIVVSTMLLSFIICCGATYMGAYTSNNESKDGINKVVRFMPQSTIAVNSNDLINMNQKVTDHHLSRTESLVQNFAPYESYGVIYDAEQDAVYYHGERVKLFVAFQAEKEGFVKNSFDLCYQDGNTDSKLYLQAVRDYEGNVTGIKALENDIASDLVDTVAGAYPADKQALEDEIAENLAEIAAANAMEQTFSDSSYDQQEIHYLTMDGTQIIERAGMTARDIPKIQADYKTKSWMKTCDQKQGAYLRTVATQNGYITYVYYNGGGRYPWNMNIDGSRVNINLYGDSPMVTADGYYLMYFTSPKAYTDIHLYLNDVELSII